MAPNSCTLAWKIPWSEEPGGLQSMGLQKSDTTERLHFHFSLSCIGEGNSNPLQGSCLENPRDGGAWWAAVYGVAQSWTRLKWLSSSSSRYIIIRRKWFDSTKLVSSSIWCLILWHKRLNKYICLSTNIYVHMKNLWFLLETHNLLT